MSESAPERGKIVRMPTGVSAFGPFRFECRTGRLWRDDAEIHLTPRASDVLRCLVTRPGEVVSKDELFAEVWKDVNVTDDALLQVISTVRKALGDDARRPEYIQTVTGRGYRFIAEVREAATFRAAPSRDGDSAATVRASRDRHDAAASPGLGSDRAPSRRDGVEPTTFPAPAPGADEGHAGAPDAPSLRAATGRRAAIGLALVAIAALAWSVSAGNFGRWWGAGADQRSIAVLPFLNMSGDPGQDYFSDGLAEELTSVLSTIDGLRVAARTSAFALRGRSVDVAEIAQQLRVAHVLEGSARRDDRRVRVTARLISAADGFELWSDTYDRELIDVFAIQQEIAGRVAEALTLPLMGEDAERVARLPTDDLDAYDAYLRGNYFLARYTASAFRAAADNFRRAIDLDPDFALAYAGLADAYLLQNRYGALPLDEALAAAEPNIERALQLDGRLGEAHAMRGLVLQRQGDFEGAQRAYERALDLNPNSARAYQLYWWMMFTREGNTERTLELADRALAADPLSPAQTENFGWPLFEAGRFDEARAYFERAIELEPSYPFGYMGVGIYHQALGQMDEAIAAFERTVSLSPETALFHLNLGHALAMVGRADEAIAQHRQAVSYELAEGGLYGDVGEVHWDARGRPDDAVRWYRQAIEDRPDSARLRVMLALVSLDLDDPAAADRWLAAAQEVDPVGRWTETGWADLGRLNLMLYRGRYDGGADFARRLAEDAQILGYLAQYDRPYYEYQPLGYFGLLVDRPADALILATRAHPELLDDDPAIDHFNVDAAIDVAATLLRTGDDGRAELLLERAEAFIAAQPDDLRNTRYREQPAEIYALQGRVPEALAALRTAIDNGWRRGWWRARHKPHYALLRDTPEFQAMLAELAAEAESWRRDLQEPGPP